jgi:TolB protein
MKADGSQLGNLTESRFYSGDSPVWSPDGNWIAFHTRRIEGWAGVAAIYLHGRFIRNVRLPNFHTYAITWMPDSKTLLFVEKRDPYNFGGHILKANIDTLDIDVFASGEFFRSPVVSPNGEHVAFLHGYEGGELYMIDPAGNESQLTHDLNPIRGEPIWSPDGSQILFEVDERMGDGSLKRDIYVINSDGSGIYNVTKSEADDYYPAWSADGHRIVFASRGMLENDTEIYIINTDGTNLIQLTNNEYYDHSPAWRPQPNAAEDD